MRFSVALTFLVAAVALAVWSVEAVDQAGEVGYTSSLKINDSGFPCIAYHRNEFGVRYAMQDNTGQWQLEYVDESDGSGGCTSLEFNAEGEPCISYYLEYTGLCYATRDSGTWQIEIVENSCFCECTSLEIDLNDNPHIAYCMNEQELRYASRISGSWSTETVSTSSGNFASLQLNSEDLAHIAYCTGQGDDWLLMYAAEDSEGNWSTEVIDTTSSTYMGVSLDVCAYDYPHIAYSAEKEGVYYARWTGTFWNIEMLDRSNSQSGFYGVDLVLDSQNRPVIVYCRRSDHCLRCIIPDANWEFETIDTLDNYGGFPSLAIDLDGGLQVSYLSGLSYDLMYAERQETGLEGGETGYTEPFQLLTMTPNPAFSSITVELNSGIETELHLQIFDLTGRQRLNSILSGVSGNHSLQVNNLPAGVYSCRAEANGCVSCQRFVLLR